MAQRCASDADFFDQHLSKMLVAPSFEQGPPTLPANAGWQPDCSSKLQGIPEFPEYPCDPGLQPGESEASTQSSDGRGLHRHTDRPHSADTDGPPSNAFVSHNAASHSGAATNPMHSMPAPPPMAPSPEFDAMASISAPAWSDTGGKYKVGDVVEVWSNSHKRWSAGTIEKLEAGGKVKVKYASPEGAAMIKEMPEGHDHLRHKVPAFDGADRCGSNESLAAPGAYKVGDKIEIYSNSQQAWCRGFVEKLQGELVHVKYNSPDGQTMTKLMPDGHEYLRHLVQQVVPPPPPPPGRSSHQSVVPPPLAESAGQEDMCAYVEAINNYDDLGASSAMASMNYGGTPGASMNQSAPALTNSLTHSATRGYRAANPKEIPANRGQPGLDDVFAVDESTTFLPSGSMLCGMPIKANKKPAEIPLNDDGTPVARCYDTERCCRCSMPVGSYFDHTCPRCAGVVCLACLDDVKFIISSYRCPHCGDQRHNLEPLKQSLGYIGMYRNAQRVVGAVPILVAGLFGFGPEGSKPAKASCGVEAEELCQPETVGASPVKPTAPTGRPSAKTNGPPPPPPRPKASAKGSTEEPEYHTRPPAGWAEGAGNWKPGQAVGGSPPDPATIAAAVQKAANGQSKAGNQAGAGGRRNSGTSQPSQGQGGAQGANPFSSATGQSPFSTKLPSPMR